MTETPADPAADQGRYLFAVTRSVTADSVDAAGMDGAALEIVEHEGLQAVVCSVTLGEFGEEPLKEHLEDIAWLERVARAHHDVVLAVSTVGTVAPVRLVTVYADDHSVARSLAEHRTEFVEALDRVEGRVEWSVKAYAQRTDQLTPSPPEERPTSGRAYLERKKQQAVERRTTSEQWLAIAEEVHATLSSGADAAARLAPQDPRLTGRGEPMVLNGAYLVPTGRSESFGDLLHSLSGPYRGLTVEVEGPWPPYTFATVER